MHGAAAGAAEAEAGEVGVDTPAVVFYVCTSGSVDVLPRS